MQVFVLLTCTLCGVVCGVVYDFFYLIRCAVCGIDKRAYTVKDIIFTAACDLLFFSVFAAAYIFTSVMFGFGGIRWYMIAGCAAGLILYLKSLHVIVAFSVKKVYNIVKSGKEAGNDRGKAQQTNRRRHGKRNTVDSNTRRSAGVSVD